MQGVSIIICTLNGKQRLAPTLKSILDLDPEVDFELILVDNGSTDGTGDFVKDYLNRALVKVSFQSINESKPGLVFARMAGLMASRFPIVLFCDDDNSLFPDYLKIGFGILEENPRIGVLGGMGIAKLDCPEPEWFEKYRKSYAIGPQAGQSGILKDRRAFVYGAGAFFRKGPMVEILQIGFYPALTGRSGDQLVSGDDVEWCWLLKLSGYEIAYEERMKFFHFLPETRINPDYYIRMKKGIAAGSALLFAYELFSHQSRLSRFQFVIKYQIEALKSLLVYLKNRLKGLNTSPEWSQRLGFEILKSRKESYRVNSLRAADLYAELQRIFTRKY